MNITRLNLENYPSFITTKTYNNYPLFTNPDNAEVLISCIYFCRTKNWLDLISFVIMPDHLHLIIIQGKKNVSQAMHSIKSFSSKEINKINNRPGNVWQASFRDFAITSPESLIQKINYIHNNPLRKNMVSDASEYKFSSANPMYETDIQKVF